MNNLQAKDSTIEYLEAESNQMPIRSETLAFDLKTAYQVLLRYFVRQDSGDISSICIIQNSSNSVEEKNIRELQQDHVDSSH